MLYKSAKNGGSILCSINYYEDVQSVIIQWHTIILIYLFIWMGVLNVLSSGEGNFHVSKTVPGPYKAWILHGWQHMRWVGLAFRWSCVRVKVALDLCCTVQYVELREYCQRIVTGIDELVSQNHREQIFQCILLNKCIE